MQLQLQKQKESHGGRKMDLLDKLLIMELSNDCRMSFSELARKHEVSVNTIKSRVDSLLERRIILGFDVHV
ncbi:MAG: Lrp/AsnC family transcriptional regulator, partial [Candidatus Thorarchaeota archaeon]